MIESVKKSSCDVCDVFEMIRQYCDDKIPLQSNQSEFLNADVSIDPDRVISANESCYENLTFNYTLALVLEGK